MTQERTRYVQTVLDNTSGKITSHIVFDGHESFSSVGYDLADLILQKGFVTMTLVTESQQTTITRIPASGKV